MADGIRSLLAPWVGGASSPPAAPVQSGFRSLLAFWAGGVCVVGSATPTPVPPAQGRADYQLAWEQLHDRRRRAQRRHRDDEDMMELLGLFMAGN